MILESDETFLVFTTAIQQEFVSQRPFIFAKLAVIQHFLPCRSPQVIFNTRTVAVQIVNHCSFVNHDFTLVPFADRLSVLRFSRNHVVERSRLAVAILTQLSIGVIFVIQHLVFGSRNVRRLSFYFLNHIQYTRVRTLANFPFKFKFVVFELVCENQIATVSSTSFTCARAFDMDGTIVDFPSTRNFSLVVTTPTVESLSIEKRNPTVVVFRECR